MVAATLYSIKEGTAAGGFGAGFLLMVAAALALLSRRLLRIVAAAYVPVAFVWAAFSFLDAEGQLVGFTQVAAAVLGLSAVATLALCVLLFTRPETPDRSLLALAVAPVLMVGVVGWALLPARAELPRATMPAAYELTTPRYEGDTPLSFSVKDGVVSLRPAELDRGDSGLMLEAVTLPYQVLASDGTLLGRCQNARSTRPGLALYSWVREEGRYVGTLTASSVRAGYLACAGDLRERLTARLESPSALYDESAYGGRLILVVGDDEVLDRIEIGRTDGRTDVFHVTAAG
jgi:hypothetical protein